MPNGRFIELRHCYPKDKQVARCGNAVPPQVAEALVRANLPEICVQRQDQAA
ncbi:hypothetical protein RVW00_000137 [Enterobacter bugandensis]|nr:hypothetical protein [Enterobacter bugandensis]